MNFNIILLLLVLLVLNTENIVKLIQNRIPYFICFGCNRVKVITIIKFNLYKLEYYLYVEKLSKTL